MTGGRVVLRDGFSLSNFWPAGAFRRRSDPCLCRAALPRRSRSPGAGPRLCRRPILGPETIRAGSCCRITKWRLSMKMTICCREDGDPPARMADGYFPRRAEPVVPHGRHRQPRRGRAVLSAAAYRGEMVSGFEVEEGALSHQGIEDAAAIRPWRGGYPPVCWPGLTEEDIRAHCRSVMAKFAIDILEEMPRMRKRASWRPCLSARAVHDAAAREFACSTADADDHEADAALAAEIYLVYEAEVGRISCIAISSCSARRNMPRLYRLPIDRGGGNPS